MARAQLRDGWPNLSDEELLDIRMSELPLAIEGTLAARIAQLRAELDARDLRFPLRFYLSDEWFTPDGGTAIAIPFYLAHPRLEKLEEAQMLEVEGGEHEWCMRILRHEAGHAIDNAFRLRRRRQRQHTFGSPSQPYPEFYTPKPYSKSFVLHLDSWYAQSHPDEDFAETFAVWLTPNSEWRQRYAGWRALGKLEYMDSLMDSLRGASAPVQNPEEVDPLNGPPLDTASALSQQAPLLRRGLTRTSTIGICAACSRMLRSLPTRCRPRSSSIASGARSGASSRVGPAFTSTRSIRCSKT
jgi:hypothetical protein